MDIYWTQNSVRRQFLLDQFASLSHHLNAIKNKQNLNKTSSSITTQQNDKTINHRTSSNKQLNNEILHIKNSIQSSNNCYQNVAQNASDTIGYKYIDNNKISFQSKYENNIQSTKASTKVLNECSNHNKESNKINKTKNNITDNITNSIKNRNHHHHHHHHNNNNKITDLDIECGTISEHDCDLTNDIHKKCKSTNASNGISKQSAIETNSYNINGYDDDNDDIYEKNSTFFDYRTIRTEAFHTSFANRVKLKQNTNKYWTILNIIICYLFLMSSSFRICSANKHDGNFLNDFYFLFENIYIYSPMHSRHSIF